MNLIEKLQTRGIVVFDDVYNTEEITELKKTLNKNCDYINQGDDRRYSGKGGTVKCEYVELQKIYELGLIEKIINKNLRGIIHRIIPDGVMWRFYYIKTPPKQKRPHFIPKGGGIGDFHFDRENPVYDDKRIDFIDFSIYLNEVGENDGNYAFYPKSPKNKPLGFEKIINIYGKPGTVIVSRVDWYHSATPNTNVNSRHLIRIAFCKNFFDVDDYIDERKFLGPFYKKKGDNFLSYIFSGDRRWYKNVQQEHVEYNNQLNFKSPETNSRMNFSLMGKTTDLNKEWNPKEIIEISLWQLFKNLIKRFIKR
jgi:hypothetical protein